MARRKCIVSLLFIAVSLLGSWTPGPPLTARHAVVLGADGIAASDLPAPAIPAGLTPSGVYRVYYDYQDELAELAPRFDIWEVEPQGGYAVMALDAQDVERLQASGYRLESAQEQRERWLLGPPSQPCYRNVEEIYAALQQLMANHPALIELIDYGDSWRKVRGLDGYDLWALRITNSQLQLPKPRFFLMANIHARELTTPETALHFVEHLLDNYGVDPDVTWILDYHEVYVVVTANPDGRQLVEEGCYQRKNRNDTAGLCILCDPWGNDHYGVDLNRNNPYRWGGAGTFPCGETYQGSAAASEPETYSLNSFVRAILPDQRLAGDQTPAPDDTTGLLISLHSYGNLVLWPWGWTSAGAPNQSQLRTLGRKFAYYNGYEPEQASELYPTTGDTTDWAYGELGIPAYTFELGEFFFQPCDELQQVRVENLEALLYAAKVARTPYLTPAGPDSWGLSVSPPTASPGSSVRLTGTVDDTRYSNAGGFEPTQPIDAAAYYVDTPPWITTTTPLAHPMLAMDGGFDEPVEEVEATLDTAGWATGRHTVYVRGRDADGNWGAFSAVFLTIEGLAACTEVTGVDLDLATEGTIYTDTVVTLSASLLPVDLTKPYTYTVDYGDGMTPVWDASTDNPLVLQHIYAGPGAYTVETSIWNCEMTTPVTDTVRVTVRERAESDFFAYLPLIVP